MSENGHQKMNFPSKNLDFNGRTDSKEKLADQVTDSFQTDYQSVIDGTWANKWKKAQKRPKHLISNTASNGVECTCGFIAADVEEWSRHAIEPCEQDL